METRRTMIDLITLLGDDTFWTAVEAIATVVAAGFLIWEVRKYRKEKSIQSFEAIQKADQIMDSIKSLNILSANFRSSSSLDQAISEDGLYSTFDEVHLAFNKLEIISKMLELDYLNKPLFLSQYSHNLHDLFSNIQYLHRNINEARAYLDSISFDFKDSAALLKESFEYSQRRNQDFYMTRRQYRQPIIDEGEDQEYKQWPHNY